MFRSYYRTVLDKLDLKLLILENLHLLVQNIKNVEIFYLNWKNIPIRTDLFWPTEL